MAKQKKRKPRMSPSPKMREAARRLMGDVEGHLTTIVYETWMPVEWHRDGHVIRELGMEIRHQGNEVIVSCKYENLIDSVSASGCIKRGTLEDVQAWLTDDTNIVEVALRLESLYGNTHTWD